MNPLQERAKVLHASLQKQAEEEKEHQQQHRLIVNEQLSGQFTTDFPELSRLLIQSQIHIEGDTHNQGQKVIVSSADKQLTIFYLGLKKDSNTWRFHGKDYQASSTESEQRLIIALAEAFRLAQSKRVLGG
jgi:hypothetical protein